MDPKRLFSAITGKGALVLSLVFSLGLIAHAGVAPAVKSVRAVAEGAGTRITITCTAPTAYSIRRPAPLMLLVELPGADASALNQNYPVASPLVSHVSVRRGTAGDGQATVLQVNLRAPVRERSHLNEMELVLELSPDGPLSGPAHVAVASSDDSAAQQRPTPTPDAQSSQGERYGQPGFVGEPINFNVVNADIREILLFITEQYGVNFVIDASVKAIPVTVNVTDVPWNIALDSILKANRLGIEKNGNILRVATTEVLAKEEEVQTAIRNARISNSPLQTIFIRLNYARASGTLEGAAGSSGSFAGGGSSQSYSNTGSGSGSSSSGKGSEGGILPIIARRLSTRGSVEVDSRSNTLIITDVRENIDAVRQLVMLLDQPEPQVEIETRIVIATRNFSRDLGVQLQGVVFGANGRGAEFSTTTVATPGLIPGGIPGGLVNTPLPSGTLGATAPNTVIGLTTGIFGTAQISALITAGESKGQAKVIASPRVTALNNRTAQIETGQQIPTITPQTGGGGGGTGATIFTTTFVSVPLRLSVTPQITDAGTVVLRVVSENNTINRALTNSLGTPGIDTQRLQTEVLVPDGGTTVMGGTIVDSEGETQNRTPGLSGIPVIGNLFKRKAVVRDSSEILFFITPRIYRPDYQGRPTTGTVGTETRTVTIPQPVPLGNPPSNTPAPGMTPQSETPTQQPVSDREAPPSSQP